MAQGVVQQPNARPSAARRLNRKLVIVAWVLFFLMVVVFGFLPRQPLPIGIWGVGLGSIWLGLNATRYHYGLKMGGLSTFYGVANFLTGVPRLWNVNLDMPILITIIVVYLFVRRRLWRSGLFGRIE